MPDPVSPARRGQRRKRTLGRRDVSFPGIHSEISGTLPAVPEGVAAAVALSRPQHSTESHQESRVLAALSSAMTYRCFGSV